MNHGTYSLSSADINIFPPEISKFLYIKKYRYRLHFEYIISNSFLFFESLNIVIVNMTTLDLFKVKLF